MLVIVCSLSSRLEVIMERYHGFRGLSRRVRRGGLALSAIKIIFKAIFFILLLSFIFKLNNQSLIWLLREND